MAVTETYDYTQLRRRNRQAAYQAASYKLRDLYRGVFDQKWNEVLDERPDATYQQTYMAAIGKLRAKYHRKFRALYQQELDARGLS